MSSYCSQFYFILNVILARATPGTLASQIKMKELAIVNIRKETIKKCKQQRHESRKKQKTTMQLNKARQNEQTNNEGNHASLYTAGG